MYILEKYLLLLIVCCAPITNALKSETIGQRDKVLDKDSISEIEELTIQPEESIPHETLENARSEYIDSTIVNNIQWKFRKHMILGN